MILLDIALSNPLDIALSNPLDIALSNQANLSCSYNLFFTLSKRKKGERKIGGSTHPQQPLPMVATTLPHCL